MNNRDITYVSTTETIPDGEWLTLLCEAIYLSTHENNLDSAEASVA